MNISISPIVLVPALVIIFNCIVSFCKSDVMKICNIIISSIISIAGIIGVMLSRQQFYTHLNNSAIRRDFEPEFISWAIKKYNFYATVSTITIICTILVFVLYLMFIYKTKKRGFIWSNLSWIIVTIMIINYIVGVVYSLETINKIFDIAGYISSLSFFEFCILYIPLILRKAIRMREKSSFVRALG